MRKVTTTYAYTCDFCGVVYTAEQDVMPMGIGTIELKIMRPREASLNVTRHICGSCINTTPFLMKLTEPV